jgi:hypothetical protein
MFPCMFTTITTGSSFIARWIVKTSLITKYFKSVTGYENYRLQYLTNPGETNGLLLTLNVQTYEYQSRTESIGIKVLIHDQNDPIYIKEGGFAVMPGRKALVSVMKKQVCWIYALPRYQNLIKWQCKKSLYI